MSEQTIDDINQSRLNELLNDFFEATSLTRPDKANKLMSQIDIMADSRMGIGRIYDYVPKLTEAGIFEGTAWSDPSKLVPNLANGTLKSGHPNSTIELLSELRLMAIINGDLDNRTIDHEEAGNHLQEIIVANLEFVFNEPQEETRLMMSDHELVKVHSLFKFLIDKVDLEKVKEKLSEELTLICAQRPVVTEKQRNIIALVKEKLDLDAYKKEDRKLLRFQRCIYSPTDGAADKPLDEYDHYLKTLTKSELYTEAQEISSRMLEFGLVSQYQGVLLLHLVKNEFYQIVPVCLGLNPVGEAKWNENIEFVSGLIKDTVHPYNCQCIYGLAKMLENGVLSREAVRSSLSNLATSRIHPKVEERIDKSTRKKSKDVSPRQYLMGSLFRILGQPLGVGQGNNPTCQSARGISMWSKHSPAKLINMVQTVAVHDDISFRFEGQEIKASETGEGLVHNLDYNLDAVSVTLVPLLDKVYNEMMRRAAARGDDPHKWVNPALYGQWILIGFASAYDYLSNAIVDFDGFTRIFYGMCHPDYNGQHQLIYPNPIGIFITSSKGEFLGFHAVSLLRVAKDDNDEYRAYFLNPNNEGRQDWGQGIKPSVYDHGEIAGESSLPLHEFAARVYAFHYNNLSQVNKLSEIPDSEIQKVKKLAKESWGQAYTWLETKKQW